MRSLIAALAIIAGVITASTVGCTIVEPGYGGILVDNLGTEKGIQEVPVRTGRVFYFRPTQDLYKFPTFLITNEFSAEKGTEFSVSSSEGANIRFDVSFSTKFVSDSLPALFMQFRQTPEEIINVFVRNSLASAFNEAATEMRSVDYFGEARTNFQRTALATARARMAPYGIELENMNIVGRIRVDETVERSINAVLTAAQRAIEAQTKEKEAQALANQQIQTARGDSASSVIRAKGQAEANRLLNSSLTSNLIQYNQVNKWDGKLPTVTGGSTPIIDLRPRP